MKTTEKKDSAEVNWILAGLKSNEMLFKTYP